MPNDGNEEDGHGGEKHDLENRVDGHEESAVLDVSIGEGDPDENLGDFKRFSQMVLNMVFFLYLIGTLLGVWWLDISDGRLL